MARTEIAGISLYGAVFNDQTPFTTIDTANGMIIREAQGKPHGAGIAFYVVNTGDEAKTITLRGREACFDKPTSIPNRSAAFLGPLADKHCLRSEVFKQPDAYHIDAEEGMEGLIVALWT